LVSDYDRRLNTCGGRAIEERRTRLVGAARGLPRPADLLALAQQRLDLAVRGLPRLDDLTAPAERRFKEVAARLDAALQRNTDIHARDLLKVTARLSPDTLHRQRADCGRRVQDLGRRLDLAARRVPERIAQHARLPALQARMNNCATRRLERETDRLVALDKLRISLNPGAGLRPGPQGRRHDRPLGGRTDQRRTREPEVQARRPRRCDRRRGLDPGPASARRRAPPASQAQGAAAVHRPGQPVLTPRASAHLFPGPQLA
jgi:hypothetical protein